MFLIFAVLGTGVFVALSIKTALGPRYVPKQIAKARVSLAAAVIKSEFDGTTRTRALANTYSILGHNGPVENMAAKDRAKSIPVLVYHGVIDNPDEVNILPGDLKEQLFALKRAGWQTVTLKDFHAFIKGEKTLPEKSFLLTFDDGRKDSYYPVDPMLQALRYNAVIFVISHYITERRQNYYLSKEELQDMLVTGRWEVEAHTKDGHVDYVIAEDGTKGHFYSNKLWMSDENRLETAEEFTNRVRRDFVSVKNEIEQALEVSVIGFAFPFGDYGQDSKNFPETETIIPDMVESIYPMSFYQVWEGSGYTFNYPHNDSPLFARIEVMHDWSADKLLKVLGSGMEKTLPYKNSFASNDLRGWIKTWGDIVSGEEALVLDALEYTTGSAAFLDGTYSWRNYEFRADITLKKGLVFLLAARYRDENNYASCTFSDTLVRAEQVLNDEREVLSELSGDFGFTGRNHEVSVNVDGDTISCYVDGKMIIEADTLDESLNYGGIGFKTWDPQMDNSELIVREIVVEEIK